MLRGMTLFDEQSVAARTEAKRPGWATALGVACGIGILGVIALALGVIFPINVGAQAGTVLIAVAAVCALGGGYDYFLYGRRN